MSRLEEIKRAYNYPYNNKKGYPYWLINRVEELEHASQHNGQLNEFLQKRKLPPNTLGRHVVDVVMDYVEKLEKIKEAHIEELGYVDEQLLEAQEDNQRYKQALEEIYSEGLLFNGDRDYNGKSHGNCIRIARKALEESE